MSAYYGPRSMSLPLYDLMTAAAGANLAGDVDFYAALAGAKPVDILEIGCGTGRVALALAARGHRILGLDRAIGMLRRAQDRRLQQGLADRSHFLCADMRRFAIAQRYDLIIAPFYSFSHLETPAQRQEALDCIVTHLRPGGRVVLHLVAEPVLAAEIAPAALANQTTLFRFGPAQSRVRVRLVDRSVDRARHICVQTLEYALLDARDQVQHVSLEELRYGWMTPAERRALLEGVGLRVLAHRSSFTEKEGIEDILILERI